MLKKLLANLKQKKEEKLKDKPMYEIRTLRTAKIVYLKDKDPINYGFNYTFKVVKDCAIVQAGNGICNYKHIKSNQQLSEMFLANIGDYALEAVKNFEETYALYMRMHALLPSDKLSYNQIVALENARNLTKYNDKLANKIFYNND